MSTARRRLKSSRSLSNTSTHRTMVTQKPVSWSWMDNAHPFCSMSIGCPIPEIRLFSNSDLETSRWRSWVWPKGKVIQSAQYLINSLPLHVTSIRPISHEIQLFRNLTSKNPRSRSWVRLYDIFSNQLMHFLFVSHQSDQTFSKSLCGGGHRGNELKT